MEPKKDVVEKGRSVRDMHHLRLMSLLQELERDNGRKKAAEVLGVDRRTLDASLDEGVLTRRIRGALEKALQSGVGSAAAEQWDRNDRLADRLEDLEGGFEELGKEIRENNRASEDRDRTIREEMAQGFRQREREQAERRTAGGAGDEAQANGAGPQPRRRGRRCRREFPDLVTLEPAEDDEEVFGEVWPLIVEWRELKAVHPDAGKSLPWLLTEERFLALELTLLEGARADASPGDVSAAGLRPQRAGQLAEDSALRHAESAEKA